MSNTFKLPSGRHLSLDGYSAKNVMEGLLEGDPYYILYHILTEAAKSLGHRGFLIIPKGYEKFKEHLNMQELRDPFVMMKLLGEFPEIFVTATLSSGPTANSDADTHKTQINLGFFCESLPPEVGTVLPPILETLDWEQHAKDVGV